MKTRPELRSLVSYMPLAQLDFADFFARRRGRGDLGRRENFLLNPVIRTDGPLAWKLDARSQ